MVGKVLEKRASTTLPLTESTVPIFSWLATFSPALKFWFDRLCQMTFDLFNSNGCAGREKASKDGNIGKFDMSGDEEKFAEICPGGEGDAENAAMALIKGVRQKLHRM